MAFIILGIGSMDIHADYDINALRNVILSSQHLLEKSTDSIEKIVSDICGLQYDPNPTIHLNQYMMLWNRKTDFKAEQLDIAAYKEFRVVETWTFKRNMFFVPREEYSLYRHAAKGIVRWGESDETWLQNGDSPEVRTADILPVFEELEAEGRIARLPHKIGRRFYYIHSSKIHLLNEKTHDRPCGVRLISPMDTVVRDKVWLETFFDYSFTFEYFKKKGMKWPLSVLVGNRFAGYIDCKMDWRTKKFVVKERNIFDPELCGRETVDRAIRELAEFHGAEEIVEKGQRALF